MNEQAEKANLYTYCLELEYDGTDFLGWQLQPFGRTVQGCLEVACEKLFSEKLRIHGAGRTDAGVHARGQVAHFRTNTYRDLEIVKKALNNFTPKDIIVKQVYLKNNDFHSRFSAKWRSYCYTISKSNQAIGRAYAWTHAAKLDINSLQEASDLIQGTLSFKSFAHPTPKELHYLSTVYKAEWSESSHGFTFEIVANRFLHGMIRLLVGTMIDVSRGKLSLKQFQEILAAEDVRKASMKAPSRGLCLTAVGYSNWPEL